ncbi:MAG: hypothetical protein Q9221_006815 [Calogaya cf. arnoldii]
MNAAHKPELGYPEFHNELMLPYLISQDLRTLRLVNVFSSDRNPHRKIFNFAQRCRNPPYTYDIVLDAETKYSDSAIAHYPVQVPEEGTDEYNSHLKILLRSHGISRQFTDAQLREFTDDSRSSNADLRKKLHRIEAEGAKLQARDQESQQISSTWHQRNTELINQLQKWGEREGRLAKRDQKLGHLAADRKDVELAKLKLEQDLKAHRDEPRLERSLSMSFLPPTCEMHPASPSSRVAQLQRLIMIIAARSSSPTATIYLLHDQIQHTKDYNPQQTTQTTRH